MLYNTTCNLFISSTSIKNCDEIVTFLKQNKIVGNVTKNKTIIKNNNDIIEETGCKITWACNPEQIKQKVWVPLKKQYNLGCAYIDIEAKYQGCINDLLGDSRCSGKQ